MFFLCSKRTFLRCCSDFGKRSCFKTLFISFLLLLPTEKKEVSISFPLHKERFELPEIPLSPPIFFKGTPGSFSTKVVKCFKRVPSLKALNYNLSMSEIPSIWMLLHLITNSTVLISFHRTIGITYGLLTLAIGFDILFLASTSA